MKIRAAKLVLVGAVLGAVWAGLGGVGYGFGQAAANPTHDGETVMNGAPKRPMTFADLMAMKRVSDPQVSPSGKWVMFSVTEVSLEKNTKVNHLWVVSLNGGDDEKLVTFGEGESFGRFSPDGKWVSYTAKDQIYLAAWDEAAGKVGDGHAVTSVTGGANGAIWSPDSRRLMFTADVYPACSVKGGGATPTHRDESAMNGAPMNPPKQSLDGAPAVEASWAEEDACDKAKDDAAEKSPVKAQVWDALLYRHWDQYTGQKRSHILVVDADGKDVRDLTPASAVGDAETPTWFLGAPLQYAWAPDSKEIAYVTNLDKVPAASTNNDVFTLRLDEPGAKAVKVSTSPGSDDAPAYSPDGKWLAFRSQKQAGFESDKFRLMVMDRGTRAIRDLMPEFDGWVDEFVWSPDSSSVYFASAEYGEEPIFRSRIASDKLERVEAYGEPECPNDAWGREEFSSLVVAADAAASRAGMHGERIIAIKTTLETPAELVSFSQDPKDFLPITVCVNSRTGPPPRRLYGASASEFAERRLTTFNLFISVFAMGSSESFWFTGAEGTKVEGFILRPPGFDPAKKYPVKFVMHGGPQTAWGDAWSYRWNWELLAADGYVVVGINRRGSTGYGQKFVDEVSGDWGGRAYEDLMKGLDYAEATSPFIDKTRECALGASYGGFMADWVLTHTDRFQCIVTHDGMFDPVSAYGSTEEMWFNEWEFRRPEDFPKGWDGFSAGYDPMGKPTSQSRDVGHPNPPKQSLDGAPVSVEGHAAEPWRYQDLPADEDPFRKWSPMRFIENAKTPTLIIHSQRDYRLDVSQGFELYTALQRRGVPSKFLYFPDEGHWVLKPQNSQLWYQTVDDWCDRWTKSGKYAEK